MYLLASFLLRDVESSIEYMYRIYYAATGHVLLILRHYYTQLEQSCFLKTMKSCLASSICESDVGRIEKVLLDQIHHTRVLFAKFHLSLNVTDSDSCTHIACAA